MQITRVAGALGARLDDIDPRDADAFPAIKAALLEHEVVFFPEAHLTEDEQMTFGRRFGPPSIFPVQRILGATEPKMTVIKDGPDSPNTADVWHTDVTWTATPPAYALLHMARAPEVGGDTLWCSATAAYDLLSPKMQEFVCGLTVRHDNEGFIRGVMNKAGDAAADLAKALREQYPPVEHPLVRTHPETGRRSLVYAGRFMTTVVDLSDAESNALIDFLGEHVKEARLHCRWAWQDGDLAVWDERSTLHRAAADHWPQEREVRRLEIDGDRPYFDPEAAATLPAKTLLSASVES